MFPVLQPHPDESGWFGLVRFRSPLLTESISISFPPGNEMFKLPGLAACTYGFSAGQFGHPGINARLTAPPGISQPSHALPRLLTPRHPPRAFLWHCPAGHPGSALPTTLPCGARTFLTGLAPGATARPGSVRPLARGGGHPSGTAVADSLVRSTREHRAGSPRTLAQALAAPRH
jgi:hypothetical protein